MPIYNENMTSEELSKYNEMCNDKRIKLALEHTPMELWQTVRRNMLRAAAEGLCYNNWSKEYVGENIRDLFYELEQAGLTKIPVEVLTSAEMDELGFGKWSEETEMRLIPLWMYKFLPDEINVESISGTKEKKRRDFMDTDHRGGMLAFGVIPSDKRN